MLQGNLQRTYFLTPWHRQKSDGGLSNNTMCLGHGAVGVVGSSIGGGMAIASMAVYNANVTLVNTVA